MAEKDFTENNPNMRGNKGKKAGTGSTPPKPITPEINHRIGRPVTRDVKHTCRKINVAIPIELLDKWEEIKKVKGNNLTEYITELIQKDLDSNYERYKEALNTLNNL